MTLWLVVGGVAGLLIYIAVTRAKAKQAGRREAEGDHLANHAEKTGEINERAKVIDENADKIEPVSDAEWDDFFARPRTHTERDRVRRDKGNKG